MRISDWSSDVCSSDLLSQSRAFKSPIAWDAIHAEEFDALLLPGGHAKGMKPYLESARLQSAVAAFFAAAKPVGAICHGTLLAARSKATNGKRSEEHTSELQSLMRTSYAVFCLQQKTHHT